MKYLKNAYSTLCRKTLPLRWGLQARYVRDKYGTVKDAAALSCQYEKLLIVAPHPDDELIGCYETLKFYGSKVDLYFSGLTGYDTSAENVEIRKKEFTQLAECMSASSFVENAGEIKVLKSLLEKNEYGIIFIPSPIDWHWEHRNVAITCLKLLQDVNYSGNVAFYPVTVPIPIKYINGYMVRTNGKWDLFRSIYISQSFMPIHRFKAAENAVRLKGCKTQCEPFIVIKGEHADIYLEKFQKMDRNVLNDMNNDINNLKRINAVSEQQYDVFMGR